jgi:hypothetical protein
MIFNNLFINFYTNFHFLHTIIGISRADLDLNHSSQTVRVCPTDPEWQGSPLKGLYRAVTCIFSGRLSVPWSPPRAVPKPPPLNRSAPV